MSWTTKLDLGTLALFFVTLGVLAVMAEMLDIDAQSMAIFLILAAVIRQEVREHLYDALSGVDDE